LKINQEFQMVPRPTTTRLLQCVLFTVALISGSVFAAEQCALTFSGCPQDFNGDTIRVPDNVTKLYSLVHACNASQTIHIGGTGGTSSILFVIDNTGSMKGTGGNDPTGARFNVVKDLLDTIIAKQPNAEVGLVVFREHLFFDTTTTQWYTPYFKALHPVLDSEPDQAYLPFLGLSQIYNGKRGIDIIDSILKTDATGGDLVYQPLYRNVRPNIGTGETNINGAFIGAKQAFLSAKNPSDHQFMIFLSDGEATGHWQAGLDPFWYDTPAGVAGLPTTFTVFFNKAGNQPASLTTMTNNVKVNGYSSSNPQSNIWSLTGVNYSTLMTLLMNNVIQNILVSGNPSKMVVNGVTSTIYVDSTFFFTDSFLIAETPTPMSMNISYRYVNPTTNILTDTIVRINFYIQRSPLVTSLPAGSGEVCQTVTGPVGSIPVTATLLDNNHNGYLDEIDITWTVDSTITGTPSVTQFIQSLVITTLDGQKDTLHAASLQFDLASKTIHIILTENTKGYETGWLADSLVKLTNYPMTGSGSPFVIVSWVDSAAPVIKSVCFQPMPSGDSLHVVFSEPLFGKAPFVTYDTVFTGSGPKLLSDASTVTPAPQGDMVSYGYPTGTLSNSDSLVERTRPKFKLDPCGNVPLVSSYVIGGNPFIPGKTLVPGPNGTLIPGTRIEVAINPALLAHFQNGQITGKITILDAVGNVVRDTAMVKDKAAPATKPKLVWVWDGKTNGGSRAAPGTYLSRILIKDEKTGDKQSIKMNVGIKR
jgi:von Willebrand factor type A domain